MASKMFIRRKKAVWTTCEKCGTHNSVDERARLSGWTCGTCGNHTRGTSVAPPKKATTLVSKQSLEQAIQEANAIADQLMENDAHDKRLDQLQEAISFLTGILKKSPVDMQQEGAATLGDYLDDAVMPEMAQKIKQAVDMIVGMKNSDKQTTGRFGGLDKRTAAGSNNGWVSDRDENGEPKEPELAEVPRLANAVTAKSTMDAGDEAKFKAPDSDGWMVCKKCNNKGCKVCAYNGGKWLSGHRNASSKVTDPLFITPKKAAPAPLVPAKPKPKPAAPAKPSADITQLSSDTLAKMQKALAGSEDLMNDKAAQAFIAAIAEELMNRPVETEQEKAPAAPAAAPMPLAASIIGGLKLADFEDLSHHPDDLCPNCNHPYDRHDNEGYCQCGEHCYDPSEIEDDDNDGYRTAAGEYIRVHESQKDSLPDWCPACYGEDTESCPECTGKRERTFSNEGQGGTYRDRNGRVITSSNKHAAAQGGSWINDGATGDVKESGGRTSEVEEAHRKVEDNTGIKRPETVLPSKFAVDMTSGKALKLVDRLGEDLKKLYLEAKPVTQVLDSRPVREAIEAIYRAYDMIGEASKVINKQHMQEEAEEKATEIKEKKNNKKGSGKDLDLNNEGRSDEGDTHPTFCECDACRHNEAYDEEYNKMGSDRTSSLFGLALAADDEDEVCELYENNPYHPGHCANCHHLEDEHK